MNHIRHLTTEGERWDLLAYRYYGDPHAYEQIILANPGLALRPVLPGGLMVVVPVREAEDIVISEDLPPWKR